MTTTNIQHVIAETRHRREEAQTLLQALVKAKTETDRVANGVGIDAFKDVTGESSIERAIDRARRLIGSFDRVIQDLESDLTPDDLALLAEINAEDSEQTAGQQRNGVDLGEIDG